MKKRNYIIALVIILIIFIAVGIAVFLGNSDKSYKLEEVKVFKYFKLYENKKYGVIDENGNIIIEAKYDNIDIPNPSKPIFVVYSNYDSQEGKYDTQVLNEKNEKILTEYLEVSTIQLKESNSLVPYEKSVLLYKENDKYGIINFNGKKITNALYDSVESLLYKEGSLLVEQNGKYGIISIEGKEIVSIKYDSVTADGYYDEETKYQKAGFIVGQKKDEGYRYGYINNNGKTLLNTEYSEISRITEIQEGVFLYASKNGQVGVYKDGKLIVNHKYTEIEYNKDNDLFIVKKNGKQGILNQNGDEVLKLEYSYIMISGNKINAEKDDILYIYDKSGNRLNINNKTILATENENYFITINDQNKYGIIDKNNSIIIENQYQYIEYAFDNYFTVTENGKVGVIGVNTNSKIETEYNTIQKIKNTKVLQALKNNVSEFYNSKLEKILEVKDARIINEDDYVKILNDNQRTYLDKNGNIKENKDILTNLNIFAFEENGKWGFIDTQGKKIVGTTYDMVTELNKYGFAGIKKEGKWGVINKEGKVIIEPTYEVEWDEPEFIGKYIKLNFGYGFYYYTSSIEK